MKDFEKLAKKALEERKNLKKELQESAEEIVEKAIEFFKDIAVKSVHIEINSKKTLAVYVGKKERGGTWAVKDAEKVFKIVRDILTSEDDKMCQYFAIKESQESIEIVLKDNSWRKKGGIFPPFFRFYKKTKYQTNFFIFL